MKKGQFLIYRAAGAHPEGPFTRLEAMRRLKRGDFETDHVAHEVGTTQWLRLGEIFKREIRNWWWERWMFKWSIIGVLTVAAAITGLVLVQNFNAENAKIRQQQEAASLENAKRTEAYWKSPEGKLQRAWLEAKAKADAEERATAAMEAKAAVDDRWNAVAAVWEQAGAKVVRDGNPNRMRVVLSVALARQLSEYELKMMAQAAYSRLGDNCVVTIEDEFGTRLSKAWVWGASSSK
jgi:hypothetical protein